MNDSGWERELLFVGDIVQDLDCTVSQQERRRRFDRYIELVESVRGTEGLRGACALIRSMRAKDDYGAYQTTQQSLGRFPGEVYVEALVIELPDMIERNPDWAGELLCGLANSVDTKWEPNINRFRLALKGAGAESMSAILNYIRSEERGGWLKRRVGVLSKL